MIQINQESKMKDNLLIELYNQYKGKDWFYDTGYDQFGRPVVYVNYECHETLHDLPDKFQNKQLLVHFAASVKAQASDFFVSPKTDNPHLFRSVLDDLDHITSSEDEERELELSVSVLTDELDSLEKICGSNILGEIFYEVHDGHNAVTNLSAKFPNIRERMQKLYDKYGFDIIYEEIDG